jgi:predicted MFS family arabinose efflux permease
VLTTTAAEARQSAEYRPGSLYPWLVLFILLLLNISSYMDRLLPIILMESIRKDIALTDTQIGAMGGLGFALIYSLATIPMARLADRTSRKQLIAGAVVVWSVLTACSGLATSFFQLALSRLGVAFGESGLQPAATSLIADFFPQNRRRFALSLFLIGGSLGGLVGFTLGGVINDAVGWRQAFLIPAAAGAVLAVLVLSLVREPRTPKLGGVPALSLKLTASRMWRSRTLRHLLAALALYMFAAVSMYQFGPIYLIRGLGVSTAGTGMGFGLIMGLSGIAGTLSGGILTDWLSGRDARWNLWLPVIALLLGAPLYILAWLVRDSTVLLGLLICPTVLTSVCFGPSFAVAQELAGRGSRATYVAVINIAMYSVGATIGPFVTGAISDLVRPLFGTRSIQVALLVVTLALPWSALHFWLASRHIRGDLAEAAAVGKAGMV